MAAVTKSRAIAVTATTVAAGLAAATALAVPPPASSSFAGKTNQTKIHDHGVTLDTDANGHVSRITLGWQAKCKQKGKFWTANTVVNGGATGIPQTGDVFHELGSYTGNTGDPSIKGKVSISLKGQFSDADHAAGTWNAKVIVKKKGKTIDKCKSPTIKWKVARSSAG
jgi:hypothetical protein